MEEITALLTRIAEAFEEQNRQNAVWIETQKQWREEGLAMREADGALVQERMALEQRLADLHVQHAKREEEWKAEIRGYHLQAVMQNEAFLRLIGKKAEDKQ